jgi:putative component of membrane protein insertase Oxa1/YidC/SpoIIIJ protein YidD
MYGAIESHGPARGIYLGVRRLLKCHPWHPGGIDLVPPQTEPKRTELHGR